MIIIIKETAQMRIFLDFTNLLGDAVVWSRGGLFPDLRQHRTIPALRLNLRSGGCGTASALPKCSIRHPVLSALLA